jgi:hypothetical protein
MRLRDEVFTFGLKRKKIKPVIYQRIDNTNVRIGIVWFCLRRGQIILDPMAPGVMIHYDQHTRRFIANSWYSDINTDEL